MHSFNLSARLAIATTTSTNQKTEVYRSNKTTTVTFGHKIKKLQSCFEVIGGPDGTWTRYLWRDRPAYLPLLLPNQLHHTRLTNSVPTLCGRCDATVYYLYPTCCYAYTKRVHSVFKWSGRRESNPRSNVGNVLLYHWATPAYWLSSYLRSLIILD